mgnify:CR=1 FL=1
MISWEMGSSASRLNSSTLMDLRKLSTLRGETKNGYSDLVIMSMEAYESLTEGPQAVPGQKLGEMCFLTCCAGR